MEKQYKIGTDEQQAYLKDYNIAPKGCAFLEPGVVAKDAKEFVAFNIAKSFYQVYPVNELKECMKKNYLC